METVIAGHFPYQGWHKQSMGGVVLRAIPTLFPARDCGSVEDIDGVLVYFRDGALWARLMPHEQHEFAFSEEVEIGEIDALPAWLEANWPSAQMNMVFTRGTLEPAAFATAERAVKSCVLSYDQTLYRTLDRMRVLFHCQPYPLWAAEEIVGGHLRAHIAEVHQKAHDTITHLTRIDEDRHRAQPQPYPLRAAEEIVSARIAEARQKAQDTMTHLTRIDEDRHRAQPN